MRIFVRFVLTSPVVLLIGLIQRDSLLLRFGITNWIPAFLGTEMGFSESQYLTAFSMLVGGDSRVLYFRLDRRSSAEQAGDRWLYRAAVAGGADLQFTWEMRATTVLLIVTGLMGGLIYGPQLIVNILTQNVVPLKAAGVAVGFVVSLDTSSASLLRTWLCRYLQRCLSWGASFTVLCLIALAGAAITAFRGRHEKKIVKA